MKKAFSLFLALLLLAAMCPSALAAADVTVYVNVIDNGALVLGETSGQPMIAVPVTVPKGSTVSDVLSALHALECSAGAGGYASASMDFGYGTPTAYVSRWFGRTLEFTDGSVNVAAFRNHSMSSTLDSTVRDGDVIDVCLYTLVSSMNRTYACYGLSWMDYFAAEAGVGESFTVGVWRSSMDMMTYQYVTEPCTDMQVSVNGTPAGFRVQPDGSLTLSFDAPGDYYVTVGGDTAYGTAAMKVTVSEGASFVGRTFAGPGRLAASGLDGGTGGAPITVCVTVTDCGDYARNENDGSALIAVPVTVPEGATVDDVLDALHALACASGTEGYASGAMELYGAETCYITKWFGENADSSQGSAYAAAAWVNQDAASTLATPVSDGDCVNAIRYRMTDPAAFLFEYYGLCYFDHTAAEAAPGEAVTLHAYMQSASGFMGTDYHPVPLSGLTVFVNGEATDFVTDAAGGVTLTFGEPGVYDILAAGDGASAAAAMRLTVKDGASFASQTGTVSMEEVLAGNLSAPGRGTGADVTVYVTVTDNGDYAKSDLDGSFLIAVPVTVPGGSTVDDALQAFHARVSAAGAMGYSSYKMDMWGTGMYSIGTWFGRTVDTADGSRYSVTAWLNRDPSSTLSSRVKDGDTIDAVIYGVKSSMNWTYSYWGLSYFDYPQVTAGVNDEITLKAYHSVMDPQSFLWNTFQSADMTVFVNGEKRTEKVGKDGVLKLSFAQPGEYCVLARPGDDSYAAAAAKIVVEEGASFADNAPADTPAKLMRSGGEKADYGKLLPWLGGLIALAFVASSVVRVVKIRKQSEEDEK